MTEARTQIQHGNPLTLSEDDDGRLFLVQLYNTGEQRIAQSPPHPRQPQVEVPLFRQSGALGRLPAMGSRRMGRPRHQEGVMPPRAPEHCS